MDSDYCKFRQKCKDLKELKGKEGYEELDLDTMDSRKFTLLQTACWFNYFDDVKLILEHPKINTNKFVNDKGGSPLMLAIRGGSKQSAILMIQDKRVDINLENDHGCAPAKETQIKKRGPLNDLSLSPTTPFKEACLMGNDLLVEYFMIHKHDDIVIPEGFLDLLQEVVDASYYMGKNANVPRVLWLLKPFVEDRSFARRGLFRDYKFQHMIEEYMPQYLFLLNSLYEGGYFVFSVSGSGLKRLFGIMKRLPEELKMLLCNISFGSKKMFISSFTLKTELMFLRTEFFCMK